MRDGARHGLVVAGAVIAVLAVAFGLVGLRHLGRGATLDGAPAPAFDLPLVGASGERLALASLSGKVVLLDFWASWCPPCRASVPVLSRIHDRYPRQQVQVLGINTESELDEQAVEAAQRALGATYPTVQDTRGEAQRAYRVEALPTIVLVGRDGTVEHVEVGQADEGYLVGAIDELLR